MLVSVDKKSATYYDYLQMPEGAKYQLIGGEIVEMPSPTLYHQRIVTRLSRKISNFILDNGLGEVFVAPLDVYFSDEETYQPDILVLFNESLYKMQEKYIEGAPDLIIEVLSPNTAHYDLNNKKFIYQEFGVKEYWIVDPNAKSIKIFENHSSGFILISEFSSIELLQSKLISGFEISLSEIF